jgi:small subunit ribosomal protein S6
MEERQYDLIFICRPDTPEAEVDKLVATLEQTATERGGRVEKVERWGTKKLAYRVRKQREGFYVYMMMHGTQGEMIKELERRLKVADPVIKYLTVRLDDEMKRQQKLGQRRDRRNARRRRKTAPPAGSTEAPAAGAPAA